MNTLMQCMRNLLSSFTRHRHLVHAGYTFAGNGSWIMQDGTFSLADFTDAYQENEVQRVIRAYENSISITIHCAAAGDWAKLPQMPFVKHCKITVNPTDILDSGSQAIKDFTTYLEPYIVPASLEQLLVSSDVVGNIRFSHPTLYVFPGGQGDAALFGINGFNMLVDGGFSRKACWWDFARHLDRLDAVLLTRLNNCSAAGMAAVLRRKATANVYPQIGHFFCNLEERRAVTSPDGDKDTDPLLVSLLQEGSDMMADLRHINLKPQHCYRSPEPINLYHKVGHGTLDMYVLNPSKDSKHVREFLKRWHSSEQKLFEGASVSGQFNFPIPNLVSICALLVWRPANPDDTITRIMFPGSTPQHKIFEGLEKLKNLEILQHPTCTGRQLATAAAPAPTPAAPAAISVIKTKAKSKERSIITETKTKDEKIHETEHTRIKAVKDEIDSKNLIDNKLLNELVDGEDKKIESVLQEAIAARMDSKLDDKFAQYESTVVDGLPKKKEAKKKDKPIDKKAKRTDDTKEPITKAADLKKAETEAKIKPDIKKKSDLKAKPETPSTVGKSKISHRTTQKKVTSTVTDKRTILDDKKSPPTTPKKSVEPKSITNIISKEKVKGKTRRQSPITTPAKSVKEASNRRVVESKLKQASPKRDIPQKASDKKETKPKREPISRRPRPIGSPIKGLKSMKSPLKSVKATKGDTAKLKGLQRVNYEDILKDAKKSDEDTSKSLDDIKQQELDEREEQEIVREIEAVFNRDSEAEEKMEYVGRSDIEKITCLIDDTKTDIPADTEFEEEYLIIEKEEVDQFTEDSIVEQEISPEKEADILKHLKDKDECEKKKEDLTSQVKITSKTDTEKITKEEIKHDSKEHSESLEEKQDISSEKKTTDSKSLLLKAKDSLDLNIVQESQPDEKISTTVESGATTAPTLPEDERITLDEIKEDQHVEEKYTREETKETHMPQPFIDRKPLVSERIPIKEPQPGPLRDVVKTPDEVADLPLHEEVDYRTFEEKKTPIEETVYKQKLEVDLQKDLKIPKDLPIKDAISRTIQDDVIIKTVERASHPEIVTVTPGSAPESPMYHDQTKVIITQGKDLEPVKEYDDNEYIYGQFTEKLRETHITTLDSPIKDEVKTVDDTQTGLEKIPSIPEDVEKEIEEEDKLETLEKSSLSPKDVERIVADVAQVLKSDKSLDELIAEKSPIFRKSPEGFKKIDDTHYKEISPMRSLTSEDVSDVSDKTVLSDEKKVKRETKLDTELISTLTESEVKKPQPKLDNGEVAKHLSEITDEKQEKRLSITLDSAKTLEKLEEKIADLKKKEESTQKEVKPKETSLEKKVSQVVTTIDSQLTSQEKESELLLKKVFEEQLSSEKVTDFDEKFDKDIIEQDKKVLLTPTSIDIPPDTEKERDSSETSIYEEKLIGTDSRDDLKMDVGAEILLQSNIVSDKLDEKQVGLEKDSIVKEYNDKVLPFDGGTTFDDLDDIQNYTEKLQMLTQKSHRTEMIMLGLVEDMEQDQYIRSYKEISQPIKTDNESLKIVLKDLITYGEPEYIETVKDCVITTKTHTVQRNIVTKIIKTKYSTKNGLLVKLKTSKTIVTKDKNPDGSFVSNVETNIYISDIIAVSEQAEKDLKNDLHELCENIIDDVKSSIIHTDGVSRIISEREADNLLKELVQISEPEEYEISGIKTINTNNITVYRTIMTKITKTLYYHEKASTFKVIIVTSTTEIDKSPEGSTSSKHEKSIAIADMNKKLEELKGFLTQKSENRKYEGLLPIGEPIISETKEMTFVTKNTVTIRQNVITTTIKQAFIHMSQKVFKWTITEVKTDEYPNGSAVTKHSKHISYHQVSGEEIEQKPISSQTQQVKESISKIDHYDYGKSLIKTTEKIITTKEERITESPIEEKTIETLTTVRSPLKEKEILDMAKDKYLSPIETQEEVEKSTSIVLDQKMAIDKLDKEKTPSDVDTGEKTEKQIPAAIDEKIPSSGEKGENAKKSEHTSLLEKHTIDEIVKEKTLSQVDRAEKLHTTTVAEKLTIDELVKKKTPILVDKEDIAEKPEPTTMSEKQSIKELKEKTPSPVDKAKKPKLIDESEKLIVDELVQTKSPSPIDKIDEAEILKTTEVSKKATVDELVKEKTPSPTDKEIKIKKSEQITVSEKPTVDEISKDKTPSFVDKTEKPEPIAVSEKPTVEEISKDKTTIPVDKLEKPEPLAVSEKTTVDELVKEKTPSSTDKKIKDEKPEPLAVSEKTTLGKFVEDKTPSTTDKEIKDEKLDTIAASEKVIKEEITKDKTPSPVDKAEKPEQTAMSRKIKVEEITKDKIPSPVVKAEKREPLMVSEKTTVDELVKKKSSSPTETADKAVKPESLPASEKPIVDEISKDKTSSPVDKAEKPEPPAVSEKTTVDELVIEKTPSSTDKEVKADKPEPLTVSEKPTEEEISKDKTPSPVDKAEKPEPLTVSEKPTVDELVKEKTPSPTDKEVKVEKPEPLTVAEKTTAEEISNNKTPSPVDKAEKPEPLTVSEKPIVEEITKDKTPSPVDQTEKPEPLTVSEKPTVDELVKEKTPSPTDKEVKAEKLEPLTVAEKTTVEEISKDKTPSPEDKAEKPEPLTVSEKPSVDELVKEKTPSPTDKEVKAEKPEKLTLSEKPTVEEITKDKTPSPVDKAEKPEPLTVSEKTTVDEFVKEKTPSPMNKEVKAEKPEPLTVAEKITVEEISKDKTPSPVDKAEKFKPIAVFEKPTVDELVKEKTPSQTDKEVKAEKPEPLTVAEKTTVDEITKDKTPSPVDKAEKPEPIAVSEKPIVDEITEDKTPSPVDNAEKPEPLTVSEKPTVDDLVKEKTRSPTDKEVKAEKLESLTVSEKTTVEEITKDKTPSPVEKAEKAEQLAVSEKTTVEEISKDNTPSPVDKAEKPEPLTVSEKPTVDELIKEKTPSPTDKEVKAEKPEPLTISEKTTVEEIKKDKTPKPVEKAEKAEQLAVSETTTVKEISKDKTPSPVDKAEKPELLTVSEKPIVDEISKDKTLRPVDKTETSKPLTVSEKPIVDEITKDKTLSPVDQAEKPEQLTVSKKPTVDELVKEKTPSPKDKEFKAEKTEQLTLSEKPTVEKITKDKTPSPVDKAEKPEPLSEKLTVEQITKDKTPRPVDKAEKPEPLTLSEKPTVEKITKDKTPSPVDKAEKPEPLTESEKPTVDELVKEKTPSPTNKEFKAEKTEQLTLSEKPTVEKITKDKTPSPVDKAEKPELLTVSEKPIVDEISKDKTLRPVDKTETSKPLTVSEKPIVDEITKDKTPSPVDKAEKPEPLTVSEKLTVEEITKHKTPSRVDKAEKPEPLTISEKPTIHDLVKEKDKEVKTDKPDQLTVSEKPTVKEIAKDKTPSFVDKAEKPEPLTVSEKPTVDDLVKEKTPSPTDKEVKVEKPDQLTLSEKPTVEEITIDKTPSPVDKAEKPEPLTVSEKPTVDELVKEKTPSPTDKEVKAEKPEQLTLSEKPSVEEITKDKTPSPVDKTEKPEPLTVSEKPTVDELVKEKTPSPMDKEVKAEKPEQLTLSEKPSVEEITKDKTPSPVDKAEKLEPLTVSEKPTVEEITKDKTPSPVDKTEKPEPLTVSEKPIVDEITKDKTPSPVDKAEKPEPFAVSEKSTVDKLVKEKTPSPKDKEVKTEKPEPLSEKLTVEEISKDKTASLVDKAEKPETLTVSEKPTVEEITKDKTPSPVDKAEKPELLTVSEKPIVDEISKDKTLRPVDKTEKSEPLAVSEKTTVDKLVKEKTPSPTDKEVKTEKPEPLSEKLTVEEISKDKTPSPVDKAEKPGTLTLSEKPTVDELVKEKTPSPTDKEVKAEKPEPLAVSEKPTVDELIKEKKPSPTDKEVKAEKPEPLTVSEKPTVDEISQDKIRSPVDKAAKPEQTTIVEHVKDKTVSHADKTGKFEKSLLTDDKIEKLIPAVIDAKTPIDKLVKEKTPSPEISKQSLAFTTKDEKIALPTEQTVDNDRTAVNETMSKTVYVNGHFQSPKSSLEDDTKDTFDLDNCHSLSSELKTLSPKDKISQDDFTTKSPFAKQIKETEEMLKKEKSFYSEYDIGFQSMKDSDDKLGSLSTIDSGIIDRDSFTDNLKHGISSEDISKDVSVEEKYSFETSEKSEKMVDQARKTAGGYKVTTSEFSSYSDSYQSTSSQHSSFVDSTQEGPLSDVNIALSQVEHQQQQFSIDSFGSKLHRVHTSEHIKDKSIGGTPKQAAESQLVKTIHAAFKDESIQQGIKTEDFEYFSSKVDRVSTPPTVPVSPLPKVSSTLQDLKLADGVQSEVKYDKLQGAEETITKIVHVGEDVLTQKISTSTEKVPKTLKSDKEDEDTLSLIQTMGKIKTETDTVTKIIKDGDNVVTQTITTVTTKEIISREDGTPQNVKTTIETTTLSKSSDGSITTTTDTQTLLSECSSSLRSTSQMDLYDKDKKLDKLHIEHGDEKSESEYSYQTQESYSEKGFSERDKSHFIKEDEEIDSNIEAIVINTDVSKKIINENNLDIIETITTTTKKETIRIDDNKKINKTTVETNTTKEYPDGSKNVQKNVEVKTEDVTVASTSSFDKLLANFSLLEEPEENVSIKTETVTYDDVVVKRTISTKTIKSKYVDNDSIPRKLKTVTIVTTTDEYPDGSTQTKIDTSTSLADIEVEDIEETLDLSEYTIEEDTNVEVQRQENNVILDGKNVLQIVTTITTKKVLSTEDKAKKKLKTIVETITESILPDGITEVTKDVKMYISDYITQPEDFIPEDIPGGFLKVGKPQVETKTEKETTTDSGVTLNRTVTITTTIQKYVCFNKMLKRIKTTVKTITEDEYPDGSVITKTSERVSTLDEQLENDMNDLKENELKDALQSTRANEIIKELLPIDEPEETETVEREEVLENDLIIKRTICTKIIKSHYSNMRCSFIVQKVVKTITTTDVFPDGSSKTSVDTTTSISEIFPEEEEEEKKKEAVDEYTPEAEKDVKVEKRTNILVRDGVKIKQVITTTTTTEIILTEDSNKKIKTTVETVTESTSPNGSVEVVKDVKVSITDYEEDKLEETLKEFIEIGKPVITQSSDLEDVNQNGITISRKTTITTTKQEYERTSTRSRKVKIIVETVIEDEYPDGTVITKRSEKISIADVLPTMTSETLEDEEVPKSLIDDTEIVEDTTEEMDIKQETFLQGSIIIKRTITTKTKRDTLASDDQNIKRVRTTVETTTVDEYPDGSVETTKDVKITISEYQKTTDSDLQAALRGLTSTGKIKTSVDKQSNHVLTESNEHVTQKITTYTTKEEFKNNDTSEIAVKTVTETVTENVHNDGTIETTKDVRTQITYLPPGTGLDDWSPEDLEKITSKQPTTVEDKPKIDDLILEDKHGKNVAEKPRKQRSPVGEITTDTETFTKIIKEGDNEITQTITVVTTKEVITPEKIKITVETTTVSKGNDGIVKTTKSTKTTISEIKEEYEEIIDTGESEKSFSKLSSKTGDMRSSSAASDDLDHPGISTPPSDISSRGSRAATHVWGTESSGMYYSDDDGQMSPSSTKSQIAHSPRSNVSFELDPKLSQLSETCPDLPEDKSEFESMTYRESSPSVHLSHIVDTDSCTSSTHSEVKSEVQVIDKKQSFKSDITFLKEADEHFEKAIEEHKKVSGSDVISSITAKYELGQQSHSSMSQQLSSKEESTITLKDIKSESKKSSETSSFSATRQESKSKTQSQSVEKDPIESWGKPLGLPSPIQPPTQGDSKNTPKRQGPSSNVQLKNKLNQEKSKDMKNRASESPSKKKSPSPVYMELTYVPHHGNSYYSAIEFFKRVRARYYVFSGTEPSKEIYNALLDAKKTWEDKELEVTIIPTYDTDVLGYWVTENEEALEKYKIDLSPSASRCTINLQDHETSCAAYRLEF
ncbi:PREDICTED: microtubule-associated protein futsch-like [Papilio polytes]|uniref:microtubule-associated protein futsch-like n=1 Tax=Papilio polytes TaxID=76194 RepID=UPI0006767BCC|nr:PREDICTED: microtubule-associated protein futsch-like [Papilio polytes]